jgi:hypothetical protein
MSFFIMYTINIPMIFLLILLIFQKIINFFKFVIIRLKYQKNLELNAPHFGRCIVQY